VDVDGVEQSAAPFNVGAARTTDERDGQPKTKLAREPLENTHVLYMYCIIDTYNT
jgi:hypothetical protein